MQKRDIEMAFQMLSEDGKKITVKNIQNFFDKYFPHSLHHNCNKKVLKLLGTGREELTKEALTNMLLHKPLACVPFEDTFKIMEPSDTPTTVSDETLVRLIKTMNPYGLPYKGDIKCILDKFDADKDGAINLRDFEKMDM
ncbi:uncharacterized protein BJ171DRAFT_580809 [Polychytrium aggregatum]|uniref:uncharacterized protein n=1 Tax=Polychytrium aggregatum TaxID=110093 RepID=UPI0022FEC376|nr:uncharacterized protein BJ171DRAFT_580809 [Polychytrium aggregatum]KAI9205635.1 hypothetical protein BJ171DRAFT_580809 [Polychytrium aggregatum]